MKVHVSLDVNNVEQSLNFYSTLFATEPSKVKPGYAKFDLSEPAVVLTLNERPGHVPNGPNHLGVRVRGLEQVLATRERLVNRGYKTADEMGTTCCYALQDKIWAIDPTGYRWEVYVFHSDADKFGSSPVLAKAGTDCCSSDSEEIVDSATSACCSGAQKEQLQSAGCGCK